MAKGEKGCFIVDSDVLYTVADGVKRVVVPVSCRMMIIISPSVIWVATKPICAYLRDSSMYVDVQTFCKTCPTCQKTCYVRQSDRVYLQPLPVISTPFRHIAMDIDGPLVRSSGGHQYILVITPHDFQRLSPCTLLLLLLCCVVLSSCFPGLVLRTRSLPTRGPTSPPDSCSSSTDSRGVPQSRPPCTTLRRTALSCALIKP